ncbi:hypothetical protein A5717_26055 [Mycolicibacterium porcinum]|uniref:hypothetical protein n=1 Tax=Mycolicibacterium porcinum TaxID=39693 RepID=UPI00080B690A|nr:hypothetical protein [Mycolicibacterium porcinum]OCB09242.1 hypothetical protein A5717_26055 [Mycolicibacterium porcinum]
MDSASEGTVNVQGKPDFGGFKDGIGAALFALGARDVLVQFAEWLDTDQKMVKRPWCGGDVRTSEELVDQFIEAQCAKMGRPAVSVVVGGDNPAMDALVTGE